jgi:hypothetical protein
MLLIRSEIKEERIQIKLEKAAFVARTRINYKERTMFYQVI